MCEAGKSVADEGALGKERARIGHTLVLSVALAVMLGTVVLVQAKAWRRSEPSARAIVPDLQLALPAQMPGWGIRELPLGQTEAASDAVGKVLKFDSYIYREFRRGDLRLSVYVAYWGRGRMPTQLVASHTPDRCWTEAGWKCDAITHNFHQVADGRHLLPSERRVFADQRVGTIHVQYWHLVDGHPYDFGERFNLFPSPWLWWRDATAQLFHPPPEQYFIRITSNRPFEEVGNDPGFAQIIAQLPIVQPEDPAVKKSVTGR